MKYYKRIIDDILKETLETSPAVLLVGPMWSGKTFSAKEVAKSAIFLDPEDENNQENILAIENPSFALNGESPRLIDEWQVVPKLWGTIKKEVDIRQKVGQFILTGSSTPLKDNQSTNTKHPGTGRITSLRMRPMSLYESKDSFEIISLKDLFNNPSLDINYQSDTKPEDIAYLVCRGGWPGMFMIEAKEKRLKVPFNYISSYIGPNQNNEYLRRMRINKTRLTQILKSLARNVGQSVSIKKIKEDIKANDLSDISEETISKYLSVINELFLSENVSSWNPNLRSKASIQSSDTRYFTDQSLGTAVLNISPNDLLNDPKTFGFFFENMAIRDLRTYAESLDGNLYHYRDETGLEIDAVIHLRDGRYALCEIKLFSSEGIEIGAKNLLKLTKKIDEEKMNKPSFLAIITAGNTLYKRKKDGIWVIPLNFLKP